jgi:hypothetical protein
MAERKKATFNAGIHGMVDIARTAAPDGAREAAALLTCWRLPAGSNPTRRETGSSQHRDHRILVGEPSPTEPSVEAPGPVEAVWAIEPTWTVEPARSVVAVGPEDRAAVAEATRGKARPAAVGDSRDLSTAGDSIGGRNSNRSSTCGRGEAHAASDGGSHREHLHTHLEMTLCGAQHGIVLDTRRLHPPC